MALTKLVEEIANAVDNKQFIVGVFIDLMKVFDTIDHRILTMKLERYGIRGTAHSWIQSYMEERFQFVSLTNVNSNLIIVTYGVPQGSVLGPLLFVLYVNDICEVSKLLKLVLFADDTSIYCSGQHLKQLLNAKEI